MTTDPIEYLDGVRERVDAATEGPWHWVDPETDLPCMPDEPCATGDHDEHAYRLSLRTVTEFPTRSVGPLPKFIIHSAEEFQEVEVAPGKWKHPDAALIAHSRTDVDVMERAIRAVMEEHPMVTVKVRTYDIPPKPMYVERQFCSHCKNPGAGDAMHPWPCPTIRTLTTAISEGAGS